MSRVLDELEFRINDDLWRTKKGVRVCVDRHCSRIGLKVTYDESVQSNRIRSATLICGVKSTHGGVCLRFPHEDILGVVGPADTAHFFTCLHNVTKGHCFECGEVDFEGDTLPLPPLAATNEAVRLTAPVFPLQTEGRTLRLKRPWILGLIGEPRSGKDSVASMMMAADPNIRRVGLADAAKMATSKLYGLPQSLDWWELNKDKPLDHVLTLQAGMIAGRLERLETFRDLLIHVATTVIRELDADFWLRIARKLWEDFLKEGHPVIVTDLRNENEIVSLRDYDGVTCRVVRSTPGLPEMEADWRIQNDSTLGALKDKAMELLESMQNGIIIRRLRHTILHP